MSRRTDTERLEWVAKNVSSVSQRKNEDALWKLFFFAPVIPAAFEEVRFEEFRAAIDAAMTAEQTEMTRYTDADRRAWLAQRAEAANWFDQNGYIDPQTAASIDSLMRMEERDE